MGRSLLGYAKLGWDSGPGVLSAVGPERLRTAEVTLLPGSPAWMAWRSGGAVRESGLPRPRAIGRARSLRLRPATVGIALLLEDGTTHRAVFVYDGTELAGAWRFATIIESDKGPTLLERWGVNF